MFKYLLISIVIGPLLVGVIAAKFKDAKISRLVLRVGAVAFAVMWFGVLYYLRYRWT